MPGNVGQMAWKWGEPMLKQLIDLRERLDRAIEALAPVAGVLEALAASGVPGARSATPGEPPLASERPSRRRGRPPLTKAERSLRNAENYRRRKAAATASLGPSPASRSGPTTEVGPGSQGSSGRDGPGSAEEAAPAPAPGPVDTTEEQDDPDPDPEPAAGNGHLCARCGVAPPAGPASRYCGNCRSERARERAARPRAGDEWPSAIVGLERKLSRLEMEPKSRRPATAARISRCRLGGWPHGSKWRSGRS